MNHITLENYTSLLQDSFAINKRDAAIGVTSIDGKITLVSTEGKNIDEQQRKEVISNFKQALRDKYGAPVTSLIFQKIRLEEPLTKNIVRIALKTAAEMETIPENSSPTSIEEVRDASLPTLPLSLPFLKLLELLESHGSHGLIISTNQLEGTSCFKNGIFEIKAIITVKTDFMKKILTELFGRSSQQFVITFNASEKKIFDEITKTPRLNFFQRGLLRTFLPRYLSPLKKYSEPTNIRNITELNTELTKNSEIPLGRKFLQKYIPEEILKSNVTLTLA